MTQGAGLIRTLRSFWSGGALLRGAAGGLAVNSLAALLLFGLQLLLARVMTVTSLGIFFYVLSWLGVLVLLATAGLDAALVRFVPVYLAGRAYEKLCGLISWSSRFVFFSSGVVALCLISLVNHRHDAASEEIYRTFIVGAALLPLWALINLRESCLRGFKSVIQARLSNAIVRPVLLSFVVWVVFMWRGALPATTVMAGQVLAAFAALCVATYLQNHKLPVAKAAKPDAHSKRDWLATAIPLMALAGMYALLNDVDKIMLGLLSSVEEVGLYTVAARISTLLLFAMQAVEIVAAPMVAEFHATRSHNDFQGIVSRTAALVAALSMPLVLGILLLGKPLLSLFGAEFIAAYPALLFLIGGHTVALLAAPAGFLLTMTGYQNQGMRILVGITILNILLNIPAIHFYGMQGAAAATAIVITVRTFLIWRSGLKLTGVDASVFCALRLLLSKWGR
jgi:O-antigen/teichoic acid export membrane protein